MKIECPQCGKLHNSKSPIKLCSKCKQAPFEFHGTTIQFGDHAPIPVKSIEFVADLTPIGSCDPYATAPAMMMHPNCRCEINPPPLDRLFLMPSQVKEIPTAELRRNCGGSLAFKGIPVTVYDREADMLADFFTECMEQKRRVAYINGDDVVRNDT